MTITADVAIIGGGISGLAAAAHLAPDMDVIVLEQESELAAHSTSRSAAIFLEHDGGPAISALSTASRPFLDADHAELSAPLLEPLGVLDIGTDAQREDFCNRAAETAHTRRPLELVTGEALRDLCPVLRPDHVTVGLWQETGASLDVMGLHQLFVQQARQHEARLQRQARVEQLRQSGSGWQLSTQQGPVSVATVVNAAGAWGDHIAELAGIPPVGLTPLRRTAFTSPTTHNTTGWPFVYGGQMPTPCYFKPETGGQLLCSLADETPSPPTDARPEPEDVALALDHINTISTLDLRSVRTTWAGLRTFAPDRAPVFGMDPVAPGFVWLVGQGGWGIVTAPAAGMVARAAVLGHPLPPELTAAGISAADLGPSRFSR